MRDRETHRSTRIGETVFWRFGAARDDINVRIGVHAHMCSAAHSCDQTTKYPLRSRCSCTTRKDKVPRPSIQ